MLSGLPRSWAGWLACGLLPALLAACTHGTGWHHGGGSSMSAAPGDYRAAAPGPSFGAGWGLDRLEALDVSAEQAEKIGAIRQQYARDQVQRYREWENARRQLAVELRRPDPDPDAVAAAYDAVAAFKRETLEARVRAYNQTRAVLNPAQRERLDAMRQAGW